MAHPTRARWTLLLMMLIVIGLLIIGFQQSAAGQAGIGLLAIVIGGSIYAFAWIIALLDTLLAHRSRWTLVLILLLAVGIGPLLYALVGLNSTRTPATTASLEQPEQTEQTEQSIDVG